MENDDFTHVLKLVVMLVICLRAANYIKLVSQGYVPNELDSQGYVISDDRVDCYDFWRRWHSPDEMSQQYAA